MADEKTTTPNILDELSRIDTAEHETDSGITADHRALIVKKASDFRALTRERRIQTVRLLLLPQGR